MQSIGSLLSKHLRQQPLQRALRAEAVVTAANDWLRQCWGAEAGEWVEATSFKAGVLAIACDSSSIAAAVKLRESELAAYLATALAEAGLLKSLAFHPRTRSLEEL